MKNPKGALNTKRINPDFFKHQICSCCSATKSGRWFWNLILLNFRRRSPCTRQPPFWWRQGAPFQWDCFCIIYTFICWHFLRNTSQRSCTFVCFIKGIIAMVSSDEDDTRRNKRTIASDGTTPRKPTRKKRRLVLAQSGPVKCSKKLFKNNVSTFDIFLFTLDMAR